MATNQVIHGSNRVVENPNRYKINAVSGQVNTYDLEKVPGVITDNGTPYSKAVLDKIDNILSYLTPSVEKVPIPVEKIVDTTIIPTSLNQSWSGQYTSMNTNHIDGNMSTFNDIIPTYKWSTDATNGFYTGLNAPNIDTIKVGTTQGSSQGYNSSSFDTVQKRTTYSASYYNRFGFKANNNTKVFYEVDMKAESKPTISYAFYSWNLGGIKIFASNDGISYEQLSTISSGTIQSTFTPENYYRYFKFEFSSGSGDAEIWVHYLFINKITYWDYNYQNQFTLDNNPQSGFTNNQRVLVDTPSTTDLTGVTSNTLNGIDIPTLLQPSTKYELIYNESEDKFKIGGVNVLFDITLSEEVKRIDLVGLQNKLELGKVYALIVVGGQAYDVNEGIKLGSTQIMVSKNNYSYSPFMFSKIYENNDTYILGGIRCDNSSNSTYYVSATINNNEYLEMINYNFNVGTRIIIKEVA